MRQVKQRNRADLRRCKNVARGMAGRPAPNDIGPTPQSLRKVRRDVMLGLLERGVITQDQMNAAEAIRGVWQSLLTAMSPVRPLDGTSRRGGIVKSPLERIGDKAYEQWRDKYLPWVARAKRVRVRPWVTGFQIVMDVVVENRSLRETRAMRGIQHPDVVEALQLALDMWH